MSAQRPVTLPGSRTGLLQPAPSLRIPVTPANREFLRRMRAAELSAWQAALPRQLEAAQELSSELRVE